RRGQRQVPQLLGSELAADGGETELFARGAQEQLGHGSSPQNLMLKVAFRRSPFTRTVAVLRWVKLKPRPLSCSPSGWHFVRLPRTSNTLRCFSSSGRRNSL